MRYVIKKGFTLVELIVAFIIVAILAAVAAPMVRSMKTRAILSEGVAGMGTLQTAYRVYRATGGIEEYVGYLTADPGWISRNLGIGPTDFDGTYFTQGCYYLYGRDSMAVLYVTINYGEVNDAPKKDETLKITPSGYLIMNIDEGILQTGIPDSGYPEGG